MNIIGRISECVEKVFFRLLWDSDDGVIRVSANPFVGERYERVRTEELGGLFVTE